MTSTTADQHDDQQQEPSAPQPDERKQALAGRIISIAAIAGALIAIAVCVLLTRLSPRTDDAEVFANYIGMAPQVEGPISRLNVRDNQYVKKGDLLFEIDERPYRYALDRAISQRGQLEGQIEDEQRNIAAQQSAVIASNTGIELNIASVDRAGREKDAAAEEVGNAQAGVDRARAEWMYSKNNLQRIEPLLVRQYVTADQVDRARSVEQVDARMLDQAQAQLRLSQARLHASEVALAEARARLAQSQAQHRQSEHSVQTIAPYAAERLGRDAAVERARYDFNNTRVYAPFDARVTNLTISLGDYAHAGSQVFTLIDTRQWWVIGNFRETQLLHVHPGMKAEVYLMSQTQEPLAGTVESIGYGVLPDPTTIGTLSQGLPSVQRTLNWVRLATRYPVRVLIDHPPPGLLRIGQSSVVVLRSPHPVLP